MPKKGSVLMCFLWEALCTKKYANLMWINESEGSFGLKCTHGNSREWNQSCNRIFQDWDSMRQRRNSGTQNFSESRQRLLAAMTKSKFLQYCKKSSDSSLKVFKFLDIEDSKVRKAAENHSSRSNSSFLCDNDESFSDQFQVLTPSFVSTPSSPPLSSETMSSCVDMELYSEFLISNQPSVMKSSNLSTYEEVKTEQMAISSINLDMDCGRLNGTVSQCDVTLSPSHEVPIDIKFPYFDTSLYDDLPEVDQTFIDECKNTKEINGPSKANLSDNIQRLQVDMELSTADNSDMNVIENQQFVAYPSSMPSGTADNMEGGNLLNAEGINCSAIRYGDYVIIVIKNP